MTVDEEDVDLVVAAARISGRVLWYRSPRELWILDYTKWRESFVQKGHQLPELDDSDRWGIHVVDSGSAHQFLQFMEQYRASKDALSLDLALRFPGAKNWWDVSDLFPIVFVDFDRKRVSAFYPNGTPMEKYLPDGWVGKFEDFATEADSETLPDQEKYWIKGGEDLLALLNKRGKASL